MLSKEDFNALIETIKTSLDETSGAKISEDLLKVIGTYGEAIDKIDEIAKDIEKLKSDNADLLEVNGKLFKKIGFDEKPEEKSPVVEEDEEIKLEDVVDEKGELK
jgi:hypothetical protein